VGFLRLRSPLCLIARLTSVSAAQSAGVVVDTELRPIEAKPLRRPQRMGSENTIALWVLHAAVTRRQRPTKPVPSLSRGSSAALLEKALNQRDPIT